MGEGGPGMITFENIPGNSLWNMWLRHEADSWAILRIPDYKKHIFLDKENKCHVISSNVLSDLTADSCCNYNTYTTPRNKCSKSRWPLRLWHQLWNSEENLTGRVSLLFYALKPITNAVRKSCHANKIVSAAKTLKNSRNSVAINSATLPEHSRPGNSCPVRLCGLSAAQLSRKFGND